MNITKQQYSKLVGHFWFTQAHWQVARQLQLHCLSRLNPFIPCVCAFTYLHSSIIFTADMSSSSRPCCSVECSCKSHVSMWNTQNISGRTRISGTRVRQTQAKWYRHRYIDRYHYSVHGGHCHNQCGASSGSPQLTMKTWDFTLRNETWHQRYIAKNVSLKSLKTDQQYCNSKSNIT